MRALPLATMAVGLAVGASTVSASTQDVTFARDIAPIFQARCDRCHHPGTSAPMSLVTYADARPWAGAIRRRVASREMPPWHLDRRIGIQRYKNDPSLTDAEIRTILQWVDAGAPLGDWTGVSPPAKWHDDERWAIGTPDLVVTSPPHVVAAAGTDWWGDAVVETGLKEDRYIRAIESRPSRDAQRALHHALTFMIDPDRAESPESYVSEYGIGKYGEVFPDDAGRLMKAGSKLRFNLHYHPLGHEVSDRTSVAFVFYPKGHVPKHVVTSVTVGLLLLDDDLDIPANSVTTHRASYRLARPARVIGFQPHMHMRGRAMTLEAVYPDGVKTWLGAVDRFDFNWQLSYMYADDAAPLLPAGTILHATATYDNTGANRRNPDPDQWVGFGNRGVDEMLQCHVLLTYLDEAEYQRLASERTAR